MIAFEDDDDDDPLEPGFEVWSAGLLKDKGEETVIKVDADILGMCVCEMLCGV